MVTPSHLHVHADLDERDDDARVLADRSMALGAHARIGEDLRDRVLGRGRLLGRIRFGQRLDVVDGVIVGDVLQRVGDARDEIFLPDGSHVGTPRLAASQPASVRSRERPTVSDRTSGPQMGAAACGERVSMVRHGRLRPGRRGEFILPSGSARSARRRPLTSRASTKRIALDAEESVDLDKTGISVAGRRRHPASNP